MLRFMLPVTATATATAIATANSGLWLNKGLLLSLFLLCLYTGCEASGTYQVSYHSLLLKTGAPVTQEYLAGDARFFMALKDADQGWIATIARDLGFPERLLVAAYSGSSLPPHSPYALHLCLRQHRHKPGKYFETLYFFGDNIAYIIPSGEIDPHCSYLLMEDHSRYPFRSGKSVSPEHRSGHRPEDSVSDGVHIVVFELRKQHEDSDVTPAGLGSPAPQSLDLSGGGFFPRPSPGFRFLPDNPTWSGRLVDIIPVAANPFLALFIARDNDLTVTESHLLVRLHPDSNHPGDSYILSQDIFMGMVQAANGSVSRLWQYLSGSRLFLHGVQVLDISRLCLRAVPHARQLASVHELITQGVMEHPGNRKKKGSSARSPTSRKQGGQATSSVNPVITTTGKGAGQVLPGEPPPPPDSDQESTTIGDSDDQCVVDELVRSAGLGSMDFVRATIGQHGKDFLRRRASIAPGDTALHAAVRYGQAGMIGLIRTLAGKKSMQSLWKSKNLDGVTAEELKVQSESIFPAPGITPPENVRTAPEKIPGIPEALALSGGTQDNTAGQDTTDSKVIQESSTDPVSKVLNTGPSAASKRKGKKLTPRTVDERREIIWEAFDQLLPLHHLYRQSQGLLTQAVDKKGRWQETDFMAEVKQLEISYSQYQLEHQYAYKLCMMLYGHNFFKEQELSMHESLLSLITRTQGANLIPYMKQLEQLFKLFETKDFFRKSFVESQSDIDGFSKVVASALSYYFNHMAQLKQRLDTIDLLYTGGERGRVSDNTIKLMVNALVNGVTYFVCLWQNLSYFPVASTNNIRERDKKWDALMSGVKQHVDIPFTILFSPRMWEQLSPEYALSQWIGLLLIHLQFDGLTDVSPIITGLDQNQEADKTVSSFGLQIINEEFVRLSRLFRNSDNHAVHKQVALTGLHRIEESMKTGWLYRQGQLLLEPAQPSRHSVNSKARFHMDAILTSMESQKELIGTIKDQLVREDAERKERFDELLKQLVEEERQDREAHQPSARCGKKRTKGRGRHRDMVSCPMVAKPHTGEGEGEEGEEGEGETVSGMEQQSNAQTQNPFALMLIEPSRLLASSRKENKKQALERYQQLLHKSGLTPEQQAVIRLYIAEASISIGLLDLDGIMNYRTLMEDYNQQIQGGSLPGKALYRQVIESMSQLPELQTAIQASYRQTVSALSGISSIPDDRDFITSLVLARQQLRQIESLLGRLLHKNELLDIRKTFAMRAEIFRILGIQARTIAQKQSSDLNRMVIERAIRVDSSIFETLQQWRESLQALKGKLTDTADGASASTQ